MSVLSTTNRKSYSGDAVTTSFATNPVVFFDSSDLTVQVISALGVATTLVENTHYAVTGGDGTTGTVNLAGGSAPYGAPASGVTLLILRVVPLTQPADLVNNDGSDAEVQERAYDRLTMMVQQLNEVDSRAIKLPASEAGSAALTELPTDRASKFLAFDASKNLIASSGTTEVPVSAFMATVLDDATAADARTTLGAASLGANVFTGLQSMAAGANIASAATIDLTAATGNSPRITGTVATSAVTMNTGQWALVVADAAWPLTYNATTNKISGGVNYTLTAGDQVLYHKDLSGVVHGLIIKADGTEVAFPTTSGTISTTFTWNGSGGSSSSVTLSWQKTGNFVSLHVPSVLAISGTGSTTLASNTALPAAIRPQVNQDFAVNDIVNSATALASAGLLRITTGGLINLFREHTGTAFTNSTTCGLGLSNSGHVITYFIG